MSDENKTDTPDTPPELQNRGQVPLTRQTAELIGDKRYQQDDGTVVSLNPAQVRVNETAREAARRAEKYMGAEPQRGLTIDQVRAIKEYEIPGMPKMDPNLGDRSESYLNAIWAKTPWYAAVRYGYRQRCWPTKLPAVWPPARPADWLAVVPPAAPLNPAFANAAPAPTAVAAPAALMVVDGEQIRPARPDDLLVIQPGKPPRVATAAEAAALAAAKAKHADVPPPAAKVPPRRKPLSKPAPSPAAT